MLVAYFGGLTLVGWWALGAVGLVVAGVSTALACGALHLLAALCGRPAWADAAAALWSRAARLLAALVLTYVAGSGLALLWAGSAFW